MKLLDISKYAAANNKAERELFQVQIMLEIEKRKVPKLLLCYEVRRN